MSAPDEIRPLTRDNLSAFDAAPQVGGTSQPWVLPLGIIGAVGLGVLVFAALNASRTQQQQETARAEIEASAPTPPAALAPPEATPEAGSAPVEPPAAAAPVAAAPDVDARLRAPALVIDLSEPAEARAEGAANAGVAGAISEALSSDERFAARFGGAQRARARLPADPHTTVPQGAIITGVLETAINSDLPGYVRAVVSRDVLSFDGAAVLAPRGSRLIGQYRSGVSIGQSRAFVIWTRLVRPDGVTVDLNSPGADALGRGGLEGETDHHFFERFGGAMLLTLLGGATTAAVAGADGSVIVDVTRLGGGAASGAAREGADIGPTVRVPQGTPIRIFVARDLDFSSVPGAAP